MRVGGIITPSHMALDLGRLKDLDSYDQKYWFGNGAECIAESLSSGMREIPMLPESFDREIEKLNFTVESDRDVISSLYKITFDSVIGCAVELAWPNVGWTIELEELMPVVLMAKHTLRKLDLKRNKMRGVKYFLTAPQKPIAKRI